MQVCTDFRVLAVDTQTHTYFV